ncbi:uncharacterized protein [Dysidea avara]|uniref:uncharacterized protein n=1 Tax=Dysidea avara TaxID=196820 RepID=UPI00331FE1A4
MSKEQEPIWNSKAGDPEQDPLYYDKTNSPRVRIALLVTLGFMMLNVVITLILAIVRSATNNSLYVLLIVSLLCNLQVVFVLWYFVRKEYLPKVTLWAVFAVAIIIVIQCIFTDILVFTF